MMRTEYAELRARTNFSFLRGASSPEEMVTRAAELGLSAIGITDRDGVYGIPKAYQASKAFQPGQTNQDGKANETTKNTLKLITGAELTLALPDGELTRLTLLSLDRTGYGLLCRMLTASHAGKEKGKAALDWPGFLKLAERAEIAGLYALPEVVPDRPETVPDRNETGYYDPLRQIFRGRMALPLIRVLDGLDARRTEAALALSRRFDLPIVATNDPHFHRPERRVLHDVMTAIREITPLDQIGFRIQSNAERHLKSPAEMALLFRDMPEALRLSVEIAERCRFSPAELKYRYPSEWIPPGFTAQSYLTDLVWKGARGRYGATIPDDVDKQLRHELALVEELSFADYFLTIWEIVEFAKSRDILCQGRGSAANSVICYCLGITAIDPVRMSLLFERFLSVERGEPPDIDVDFEHERREEVIQHIYARYGRDRAAMVSAVITYRSRSALREIAKALGVPYEQAQADTRVTALSDEIHGFPRHLSIHSGGFTLSADPIIETVPVEPARMEGRTIVQWDKDDLAIIGLLKVDVLALGMLTAMKRTFDNLRTRTYADPIDLTVATTPPNDQLTYEMIQQADTIGVFQIESRAQMSMLGRLLPKTFYDLVIEVAIVRPGPIVGQMVHPYLKRRRGLESSVSPHPKLEDILGRTLGVPLFQEQVMKMAIVLAGFTPGEADELRRAINAWKSQKGSLERLGRKLMDGLLASGLSREYVERIFLQIQGFSEYGFPESHAASFALLAYVSSYLKRHHPAEFTCALINSQPMGFYSSHTLVEDVRRHGVTVLPVDPNLSDWDCVVVAENEIRLGWRIVNGLAKIDAEKVIAERRVRPFASLADFLARTRIKPAVLHRLAMGEAFACFGLDQRTSLWEVLGRDIVLGQGMIAAAAPAQRDLFEKLTPYQAIHADYESYGLSARGHPMSALRPFPGIPPTTTKTLRRATHGEVARLAGLVIVRQRPGTAKGTVFAALEDEEGFVDMILHREIFEKYHDVFVGEPFLTVTGKIQRDHNTLNLVVQHLEALDVARLIGEGNTPEIRAQSHDFH